MNTNGRQMATSDDRGNLKVWDLRYYKESMDSFRARSTLSCLDYSQRGLLAFSTGKTAVIWNVRRNFRPCSVSGYKELSQSDQRTYLQHSLSRRMITSLKFCPYEDVLGIGNSLGFSSIVVPGSGEANYDLFEADPFETIKKRNNKIVYQLLDKLQPEMIQLNPNFIADTGSSRRRRENKYVVDPDDESNKKWARKNVNKNVKKGYRGVLVKRHAKYHIKKQLHVRTEKLKRSINARDKEQYKERKLRSQQAKSHIFKSLTRTLDPIPNALDRFNRKSPRDQFQFKERWGRRINLAKPKKHF